MQYTKDVENMCKVNCGASHGCAPIPEEGKWVYSRKIEDISGFTHGIGWCAPQQGPPCVFFALQESIQPTPDFFNPRLKPAQQANRSRQNLPVLHWKLARAK